MNSSEGDGREAEADSHLGGAFQRRRRPKLARAHSTVDSILQSTKEIAEKEGFRRMTTESISRRAGISVGSLYQYFPNKEAILLSLYEEASARLVKSINGVLLDVFNLPPEKGLKIIVRALIELYERERLVLLDLAREFPELSLASMPLSVDNLIRSSMKTYIQLHHRKATRQQVETRVFVMENAAIRNIQTFVAQKPAGVLRQQYINDVTNIVITYLAPGFET